MIGESAGALLAEAHLELNRRSLRGRYRQFKAMSDRLLEQVEQVNLASPVQFDYPPRIPSTLAQAINELRLAMGLPAGRISTTAAALDRIYEAQQALFVARELTAKEIAQR